MVPQLNTVWPRSSRSITLFKRTFAMVLISSVVPKVLLCTMLRVECDAIEQGYFQAILYPGAYALQPQGGFLDSIIGQDLCGETRLCRPEMQCAGNTPDAATHAAYPYSEICMPTRATV